MGHELWISPHTGIRRKGTTFKELQTLFIDQITTKHIYEPLFSSRLEFDAIHVKAELERRDFDTIGVIDEKESVIGYINTEELSVGSIRDFTKPIELGQVITDSTSISKLIHVLEDRKFVFVINANKVEGIVTIADINKPIVRIYLFGLISLFEMHLNYWINQSHEDGSWKEVIKVKRILKAQEIYDLRKGNNQALSLLECLQLCDKRDILVLTEKFLKEFKFSNDKFFAFLENIEIIRNELGSIVRIHNWKSKLERFYFCSLFFGTFTS